jgi:hypothetical protein
VTPGLRGTLETRWDPVRLGAALITRKIANIRKIRALFQTKTMLQPWLEAWKTYEADYLDPD